MARVDASQAKSDRGQNQWNRQCGQYHMADQQRVVDRADPPIAAKYVNRRDVVIGRSEEHTSELQSLMRISYAVFCLKKKTATTNKISQTQHNRQQNLTVQITT